MWVGIVAIFCFPLVQRRSDGFFGSRVSNCLEKREGHTKSHQIGVLYGLWCSLRRLGTFRLAKMKAMQPVFITDFPYWNNEM